MHSVWCHSTDSSGASYVKERTWSDFSWHLFCLRENLAQPSVNRIILSLFLDTSEANCYFYLKHPHLFLKRGLTTLLREFWEHKSVKCNTYMSCLYGCAQVSPASLCVSDCKGPMSFWPYHLVWILQVHTELGILTVTHFTSLLRVFPNTFIKSFF